MRRILAWLMGCGHHRTTFPLTPPKRSMTVTTKVRGTYIVCLDCGREFGYNWADMRVGEAVER